MTYRKRRRSPSKLLCRRREERSHGGSRACLADDMVFEGLFETYRSADEYIKTLAGLLQITVRLDIKKIIGEGNDAARFAGSLTSGASPFERKAGEESAMHKMRARFRIISASRLTRALQYTTSSKTSTVFR